MRPLQQFKISHAHTNPDPAEDDPDLQPYNFKGEDICNQRDNATFLWEEFGILLMLLRMKFIESATETGVSTYCFTIMTYI